MDKVSIIVPVYNASKTIKRCLNSIIHQTYSNIEIVLVNDGSSDDSLFICEKVSQNDKRVKIINQKNSGVSTARNKGMENSTGEWLMFVDSDDWIESNTVYSMLELMKNQEASYGVYSFLAKYPTMTQKLCIDDSCYTPTDLLSRFQSVKNIEAIVCSVCNKIYPRSIIMDNNIRFSKEIKFGEDFIFNSQILPYTKKIVTSSELFYHYDCTIEDSGVKKLYREWELYILAINAAVRELLNILQLDPRSADRFQQYFVSNQWKYALEVCINNSCLISEKADMLYNWLKAMPEDMWQWESLQHSELGVFIQGKKNELSRAEIYKKMRRVIGKKKKEDFIIRLKQSVRRMLVK
ncbi:glycosyltransferase family 2 protein [Faecalicatena sp. Marseille-Q4148]|nr:glycosyltransferase family 2 protein [Faecalicatena sp. Marseille-Q4148]